VNFAGSSLSEIGDPPARNIPSTAFWWAVPLWASTTGQNYSVGTKGTGREGGILKNGFSFQALSAEEFVG
jgi:hypothetical protein